MSRRSDGDRGYSTELLRVLFGDLKISEYPPSANERAKIVHPRSGRSQRALCVHKTFCTYWYVLYFVQLYEKTQEF